MKHTEFEIQCSIVLYLRALKIPFIASVAGHVPFTRFQKMRSARAGYVAGVPDLIIPVSRGGFHSLALEVKAPGGYPTKEQIAWRDKLTAAGWYAVIMPARLKTPLECVNWARDRISAYLDGKILPNNGNQ
jgi:hypothetical protein